MKSVVRFAYLIPWSVAACSAQITTGTPSKNAEEAPPTWQQLQSLNSYREMLTSARERARTAPEEDTVTEAIPSALPEHLRAYIWSGDSLMNAAEAAALREDPASDYGQHLVSALRYFGEQLGAVSRSDETWQATRLEAAHLVEQLNAAGAVTAAVESPDTVTLRHTEGSLGRFHVLSEFVFTHYSSPKSYLKRQETVDRSDAQALGKAMQNLAARPQLPIRPALRALLLAPSYLHQGGLVAVRPELDAGGSVQFRTSGPAMKTLWRCLLALVEAWPLYQFAFHVDKAPLERMTLVRARTRPSAVLQYPSGMAPSDFREGTVVLANPAAVFYHDAFHAVTFALGDIGWLTLPVAMGGLDERLTLSELVSELASDKPQRGLLRDFQRTEIAASADTYQRLGGSVLVRGFPQRLRRHLLTELREGALQRFVFGIAILDDTLSHATEHDFERYGPESWQKTFQTSGRPLVLTEAYDAALVMNWLDALSRWGGPLPQLLSVATETLGSWARLQGLEATE